jgi:hypothetical protein
MGVKTKRRKINGLKQGLGVLIDRIIYLFYFIYVLFKDAVILFIGFILMSRNFVFMGRFEFCLNIVLSNCCLHLMRNVEQ